MGGYSLKLEVLKVDIKVRTSNTITLFVGVFLTIRSLKALFRKTISITFTILYPFNHFDYFITSIAIGAARTSTWHSKLEKWLVVKCSPHIITVSVANAE